MAIANGAIYPIVVAQALRPFPQATDAQRHCRTHCNWVYASGKPCGFWLIATPLLTTTSVMLTTVLLAAAGYKMQSQKANAPHTDDRAQIAHGESH